MRVISSPAQLSLSRLQIDKCRLMSLSLLNIQYIQTLKTHCTVSEVEWCPRSSDRRKFVWQRVQRWAKGTASFWTAGSDTGQGDWSPTQPREITPVKYGRRKCLYHDRHKKKSRLSRPLSPERAQRNREIKPHWPLRLQFTCCISLTLNTEIIIQGVGLVMNGLCSCVQKLVSLSVGPYLIHKSKI